MFVELSACLNNSLGVYTAFFLETMLILNSHSASWGIFLLSEGVKFKTNFLKAPPDQPPAEPL